jgi:hypothetical protein
MRQLKRKKFVIGVFLATFALSVFAAPISTAECYRRCTEDIGKPKADCKEICYP